MKLWISKNESNLLTNLGIKLTIIIQVHSHVRVRDHSFFLNLKLVPCFPRNKANATLLAATGIEQRVTLSSCQMILWVPEAHKYFWFED